MSKKNKYNNSSFSSEETSVDEFENNEVSSEMQPVSDEKSDMVEEEFAVQPSNQIEEKLVMSEPLEKTTAVKAEEIQTSIVETLKQSTVPEREQVVVKQQSSLVKFNNMANDYIRLLQPGIKSEEDRKKAVSILTNIAQFVLTSKDRIIFDACFGFIMKNKSIMLSTQTIATDLVRYADKQKITKIVQFYVIFQSLAESKIYNTRYTLNITTIRRLFNNDHLANWLIANR